MRCQLSGKMHPAYLQASGLFIPPLWNAQGAVRVQDRFLRPDISFVFMLGFMLQKWLNSLFYGRTDNARRIDYTLKNFHFR